MRRLILGFAGVAPLIAVLLAFERAWLAAIGVVALSHLLIVYATLRPNAQWLGPVVTSFEPYGKEVWLTIDDGLAADTPAILDMLDRRGARATFFVVGRPDSAGDVVARGHSVANHSATHPSATFWCLPPSRIAAEIDGGVPGPWFRAPVGMKNPFVHPALARRGLRLIGWSVRGFDAFGTPSSRRMARRPDFAAHKIGRVVQRIVPRVRPGSIIVMHQGRAMSLRCLERVIDELQQRGYSFVIPDDARLKTKR